MNNSGLYSLSGFAYQIKVFVLNLVKLNENESLGYELFDDVSLQSYDVDVLENEIQKVNSIYTSSEGISAMQVKHTSLSNDDFERVLFNWIILQNEKENINKYRLVVDESYGNTDDLFSIDMQTLFTKINKTKARNSALIKKVHNIIDNDFATFDNICKSIMAKYEFISISNIDNEIYEEYKTLFNYGGIQNLVYQQRVSELVRTIQNDIIESVSGNKPYVCDYYSFRHKLENIIESFTDKYTNINFTKFKKSVNYKLTDAIRSSRQYIQLTKCDLSESMIVEHLILEEYYSAFKIRNYDNLRIDLIKDIEETTHYNFEMVKFELQTNNEDLPRKRFIRTLKEANSYAKNDQIKKGSAIHLTKKDTDSSLLISWEDE